MLINSIEKDTVEIDITGPIGGDWWTGEGATSDELRAELKAISNIGAKKIIVNIDSFGGLVSHGIAMHDLLAAHEAEIEVNVQGMTASAATVIAMAGDKVNMSDNALFLIHRVSGLGIGHADNLKGDAKDMEKVEGRLVNIYSKRSGQDEATVRGWMNVNDGMGEWWTASEAVENGFVDEIYEPMRMAAYVPTDVLKRAGLPVPENRIKQPKNKADMNIAEKLNTFRTELVAELKALISKAPEAGTVDAEALANAKADALRNEFEARVAELEGAVAERDTKLTDAATATEALEAKVTELTAEVTRLTGGKSGGEANADPPVGDPKPDAETAKWNAFAKKARSIVAGVRGEDPVPVETENEND